MAERQENNLPEILTVNIDHDIVDDLASNLLNSFHNGWTKYDRPGREDHPRMRPILCSSEFNVIVFDAGSGLAEMKPDEITRLQILPEWFRRDIIASTESALLVVLTPAAPIAQSAVKAAFAPVEKEDLREVNYFFREPAQWNAQGVDPARDILELWSQRRVDTEPSGGWMSTFKRISEALKPKDPERL